jgi:hypothetical protein
MTERKPAGRRYEVYTDPDLYRSRPPRLARGAWLVILLAGLLLVLAFSRPLHWMLATAR